MDSLARTMFEKRVRETLDKVVELLDDCKNPPQVASETEHSYADKYGMVDLAANMTLSGMANVFSFLLNQGQFDLIAKWAEMDQTVTLKYERDQDIQFKNKEIKKVEGKTEHVSTFLGVKKTDKTFTKTTYYNWTFTTKYKISVYTKNEEEQFTILENPKSEIIVTGTDEDHPPVRVLAHTPVTVEISKILCLMKGTFEINRGKAKTPRRNDEVNKLLETSEKLKAFFAGALRHLKDTIGKTQCSDGEKFFKAQSKLFVPVMPLFRKEDEKLFTSDQVAKLLDYHSTVLGERTTSLQGEYADDGNDFFKYTDAKLATLSENIVDLCEALDESVAYTEKMIRVQVRTAIGKRISVKEVNEFMVFHYRKLFAKAYRPRAFCYDVRRVGHAPEGSISIEASRDRRELYTSVRVRETDEAFPMEFSLSAATTVRIRGPQYLHGMILQTFDSSPEPASIVARARQFSGYILLVGNLTGKGAFDPKHGIIISNKEEVLIPLLLEPLPTPKAFKDALKSLSPEQQEFCKMIRNMQLESSLFCLCVVQIKPQLEVLLNLPHGALTKEIKLTQDLIKLFCEFQVPSDLLAFDGDSSLSKNEKLEFVKKHVTELLDMIKSSKAQDLADQRQVLENEIVNQCVDQQMEVELCSADMRQGFGGEANRMQMLAGGMRGGSAPRSKKKGRRSLSRSIGVEFKKSIAAPSYTLATSGFMADSLPTVDVHAVDSVEHVEGANDGGGGENVPVATPLVTSSTDDDYTAIATLLDQKYEKLDVDNALRPTTLSVEDSWQLSSYKNLLSRKLDEKSLNVDDLKIERSRAFDLIDGLTRSGELDLVDTCLHVVVAATHSFSQNVFDCVTKDNVNPIARIERSALIVASTIHDQSCAALLTDDSPQDRDRLMLASPNLFE